MKIIINQIPPSNNKYMGNSHNFNEYRREKEKWHWLIKAAIKEKPEKPFDKSIVRITYYFSDNRKRDCDNYSGKMLLDPLVREGIIEDDSFKHIRLELNAYFKCKEPQTEIEVIQVTNEKPA